MSNIPICRLCECVPSESFDLIDIETMYYNCDTSGCPVAESGMMLTPEQWQQLMGGGEPVAIAKTRREFHEYENSALEDEVGYLVTHVNWVKKPQDVGELKLYTQAPAVDDADLRHAVLTAWIYGYEKGHDDTVESRYGCIEEQAKDYVEDQFGEG